MSTSAVPAVIDYLVAMFKGATTATVFDGLPDGTYPNDFVIVGSGTDADASDAASRDWAGLGAQHRQEEFVVVCYVQSYRGGNSQKASRDAAFAIFNQLETALRADLNLGGTVGPLPVDMTTQNVKQTAVPPPGEPPPEGRWTLIEFGVRVRNRY